MIDRRLSVCPHDCPSACSLVVTLRDGRFYNDRGAAQFVAVLTEDTRAGVAVIEGLWWHKFSPGGFGVNVLTSDRVTDLGGGPALHSNLVDISRL